MFSYFRFSSCSRILILHSLLILSCSFAALVRSAEAADHRESPLFFSGIYATKADATDFYMFVGYEPGAEDTVVLIANYQPYQEPSAGPGYFPLDPNAEYFIHIDNNGDAVEDISFRFKFQNSSQDFALGIGNQTVPIPILNNGPIGPGNDASLNLIETYTVDLIRGDSMAANPTTFPVTDTLTASSIFRKPVDNIGQKSIPDYSAYAQSFISEISLPGTDETGTMFVGQRKDPFYADLGGIFDLVNLNLTGPPDARENRFADVNVTSLILELPIPFLTNGEEPVIGGWTTARIPRPAPQRREDLNEDGIINAKDIFQLANAYRRGSEPGNRGRMTQVARLGHPLINMLFMGLAEKANFSSSLPRDDVQFLRFITNPVLPQHLAFLFGFQPPTTFPRPDLIETYLRGIEGLNRIQSDVGAEILRLNTETSPVPLTAQNPHGFLGGDNAGFPNGRRPADDVVDITLRIAMGALLSENEAPEGQRPYTDGVTAGPASFLETFPYLADPLPGARTRPSQ